jgi:hypothetical protein
MTTKIRWRIHVTGTVEGHENGVAPGDIMELPTERAQAYIDAGYAGTDLTGPLQPFRRPTHH